MNWLLKYFQKIANTLTIRVLSVAGVKDDTIKAAADGLKNRQTLTDEQINRVNGRYGWLKWLIISAITLIIGYIILTINKLRK